MQAINLKQLRTLGLVLACGALAAGCAGNSIKPMEQDNTQVSSTSTDKPIVEANNQATDNSVVTADNQASEQTPAKPIQDDQADNMNKSDQAQVDNTAGSTSNDTLADNQPQNDVQPSSAPEQPKQLAFYFGFNKSALSSQDIDVLKQHARFLKDNPMLVLDINGHTDSSGPHAYNEYLSKLRAESVAKIMIAEGVTRSQLVINALADNKPAADAKTPGENRRVDLQYVEVNQVSSK